ncbi:MAG: AMP-binding protein, partial [Halobacteria archaeon]|nr:AMP-binding protein [Halobacteria archaeon]
GEYTSITYDEMGSIVRNLAAGFDELGVEKGDRVGIFSHTRMEWAQTDFALLSLGAVVTTVYASSSPKQVEYLLGDSGSTGVVVENDQLLQRVLDVEDQLNLDFVVSFDNTDVERDFVYSLHDIHQLGSQKIENGEFSESDLKDRI